ncbi:MAG: FkbM family methyltransferase [Gallionella sp.]|jgi:FkbM family methyltransferase
MFHSQIGQDKFVVDYYKGKRDGYFVEVGAFDGVFLSNTLALERDYGWKGVCVEAIPEYFERLQKNRTCNKYGVAAYSVDDQPMELCVADVISGTPAFIGPQFIHVLEAPRVTVQTKTLNTILADAKAPSKIDYLSLDTEGTEIEVLKGVDFNKYEFGVIDVEHNFLEANRNAIRTLLESKGYTYHSENQWDDRYIRSL